MWIAGFQVLSLLGTKQMCSAEQVQNAVLTVGTSTAGMDGAFVVDVCLEQLPDTGLEALEFAISYDAEALSITEAELLYDTGAEKAQLLAYPELTESVFTSSDNREGILSVRWATILQNADYWLTEEQPFLRLRGVLKDSMPKGTGTELKIVPPTDLPGNAGISAGYLDEANTVHRCDVIVNNGIVWKPIDETGAFMYGDVNLDGEIAISDAVLLQRVIAEESFLSAAAYANADCEPDGVLDLRDISLICRFVLESGTGNIV